MSDDILLQLRAYAESLAGNIRYGIGSKPCDYMVGIAADEIERLRRRQAQARVWLTRCLDLVEGKGPPNWDGIRAFLENDEQAKDANG